MAGLFWACITCQAQLAQIDPAKLPQDAATQGAYSSLLPIEPLVHGWSEKWTYDTPKDQVVSILETSLKQLQAAQKADPSNEELVLLSGLVAHLAYNVDVKDTYDAAVQSLQKAHSLAANDPRAGGSWGTIGVKPANSRMEWSNYWRWKTVRRGRSFLLSFGTTTSLAQRFL